MNVEVSLAHVVYHTVRVNDVKSLEAAEEQAKEQLEKKIGVVDDESQEVVVQWSTPIGLKTDVESEQARASDDGMPEREE